MAINPNNGVLDIVNGVLKVSSIDIKESGGFATAINTVARNDVLLYDDQHTNTTFLPAEGTDYRSTTGVTRDTSSIDFNDGWVYWPLKLPNSWHAQFDMRITATGGVFTFSLFNTSTPNHTDYTANDGGYKIVFDNTNNQIDVYWEGSVHATASANVRSTDWQHVNINYFRGAVSISLAGKVVLNHGFTENYQEADSRYLGFSATSGTSHEIRNLAIHNSDKWFYTHTSNASDIAYVSGNVGIGSLTPTELLDVHGNVHIAQNLTVDGNLTVTGTTFSVDQTNLSIEDPIIELAKGNASDTIDSGLVITRPTSNVTVAYRGDESELALGYTQSGASETVVVPVADGGLDVRVYGNLFANNLTTTANVNATYVKGDGSELTQITLDQVVGYGNVTSNTIISTGNIHANYFHGDGSELNNISATLQEITDNSNVTSNTVQFTNSTTALVADSNVGIGTRTPSANLHVVGYQYVNDPPTQSASFDHSDAPLTLTHPTPTSTTAIDDPKAVLHLTRDGTSGESYGAKASFKMSRYENSGTASRSRLDVTLADGTYADTHVMSLRGDGRMGVGTTNPGYGLDVHGTANVGALTVTSVAGNGSALSDIQSSNVSDFASNVTRIGNLESNLSANSLRITNLESGDMSISGEKTFTGDAIFESNIRVKGDLLVANTVNMVVSDPILELGSNNLNTGDLGIVMTRHGASDSNVAIVFDESGDTLNIGYTSGSAYDTTIDIDDTKDLNVKIYGNLHVSNTLTINTVAVSITSGLDEVLNVSNSTTNTIQITNASDTALDVVGGASVGSNLEVGTANLFVDTTTGRVGLGAIPNYKLHIVDTDDTVADQNYTSMFIDYNVSGSDACTANRTHRGLLVDVDSSATGGDTTNSHKVFGIQCAVDTTGDSDFVYNHYLTTKCNFSTGEATHIRGIDNVVQVADGAVDQLWGNRNFVNVISGATGDVQTARGVYSEVQMDASTTLTNARAIESRVDNNSGTITNGYLFYGDFAGTATNKYGLYVNGEDKNYFSSNVGIGVSNPSTKLHVNGAISQEHYACFELHAVNYSSGGDHLEWKSDSDQISFNSGITLFNTSDINLVEPGIYYAVIKLNSDESTTSLETIQLSSQYYDGTNWYTAQNAELRIVWNGGTELIGQFMLNAKTYQRWRFYINQSIMNDFTFASTTWSRLMISKIA